MSPLTRRAFLATMSSAASAPLFAHLPRIMPKRGPTTYVFFRADEARFIEAACNCLIPADACGPSALDAEVPHYMDRQLAGPWGAGKSLYRTGSWQPGSSRQLPVGAAQPAPYLRAALSAINAGFAAHGASFAELRPAAQSSYLAALQAGEITLPHARSKEIFDLLLSMTAEGFFTHPQYGRTRDRLSWRLSGFPGAHAITS